ncbi:MAG: ATP-binding protein [Bacteroidota bacterium]
MNKLCYLIVSLLASVLLCANLSAQKLDSLERLWSEITSDSLRIQQQLDYASSLYEAYQYEDAFRFADRVVQYFPESLRGTRLNLRALYLNTLFASATGNVASFYDTWDDAIYQASALPDTFYLIELTNLRAGQYLYTMRYDSAYQSYQQSLDLAIAIKDIDAQNSVLNNMAIIFGEQGLVQKAKDKFWEATQGAMAQGDSILVFTGHNNVAHCYAELGEPDSARLFLDASRAFMTVDFLDFENSMIHSNYGLIAKLEADYPAAIQEYHRALYYAKRGSDAINICEATSQIGQAFSELSQYDSASYYLAQAEILARQMQANEVLRDVLPTQAKSYAALGRWDAAYQSASQAIELRDEYLTGEVQRQVAEMEAKYQLSDYERENEFLRTIGQEREEKLKQRTFFSILGLLGLLLISGLAILAWRRNETIRALNSELENKVAERTAELETANTQLQEYVEDLKVFTHVTSHDLKEPLRNISGFSSLLKRRLASTLTDDSADFMEMIRVNANQMHELVEGIQFYSMLDPQVAPPAFEPVDLAALCNRVQSSLDTFLSEKQAQCIYSDALPEIQASAEALQVTIKNLVENAIKYNDAAVPTVEINYEQHGQWHLIRVSDNGIGLEPAYYEQIFQMFKRLHTRQDYIGTGMGLGISRKLVRKFGGDITVESTVGEGSTFTVHWPFAGTNGQAKT